MLSELTAFLHIPVAITWALFQAKAVYQMGIGDYAARAKAVYKM